MVLNYFKIAFRKLFRTERASLYSWINLFGLTIGLTAFLLIGHYIHYQLRFDRFYSDHQNIYRLVVKRVESGEMSMQSAKTYAGIGNIIKEELPEVQDFVRILDEECMFRIEGNDMAFNEQRTFWADGNFHELFGLEILKAGQLDMLHKPNHAIISRSAAIRLFGNDWEHDNTPIGQTVILNEGVPFMVQGVFEDIPPNAHMKVDFVVSYATLMVLVGDFMNTVMPPGGNFVYNYILLNEGVEPGELKTSMNEVIAEHTGEIDDHVYFDFDLQPIHSIHLQSHLSDELNPNGNSLFIWALSIAAILILVVAWINFINITVAKAMSRSKEVGVRKSFGARKRQLVYQFAIETMFSSFVAMILTIGISLVVSRSFNQITEISIGLFSLTSLKLWFVFTSVVVSGTILASIYPAVILSSFDTIKAVKGKNVISIRNGYFRQGLIAFQFSIALLMIACTGAVYYQVSSMRKQSLGMDMERVLVINSPKSMIGNAERALIFKRFRNVLEQETDIQSVASGGCIPGEKFLYHAENVKADGNEIDVNYSFDMASVDSRYLETLGIELINGRDFEDNPDENDKVILNETAIKALGFSDSSDAVGQFLRISQGDPQQIIGVINDPHFEGLQKDIKPLLLKYGHGYEFGFFPIKIRSEDPQRVIKKVETQWKLIYPKDPFDYFFLDKFFDQQYNDDQSFGKLFGSFALLTIFIAGLGLIGLVSLTTYQKSKEIGIRKVFGANVISIVKLLTVGFMKLVLIAAIIAIPLSWWIIDAWLSTFAYRFDPAWWMYILPVILLMVTSLIAIGGQTIKSAFKNPVDAISDE